MPPYRAASRSQEAKPGLKLRGTINLTTFLPFSTAEHAADLRDIDEFHYGRSCLLRRQSAQQQVSSPGFRGVLHARGSSSNTRKSRTLLCQHREKPAALAICEKLAALYSTRNFPEAGGLTSYGSNFLDTHRQAGRYAGRILKGEKPGELPVQRATKFDFVVNLKTAKSLGLIVPETLLATADEVIQ